MTPKWCEVWFPAARLGILAQVLEQNATHTILTIFDDGIDDGPFEHASPDRAKGLIILIDTVNMRSYIPREYKRRSVMTYIVRLVHGLTSAFTMQEVSRLCRMATSLYAGPYNSHISEHTPNGK